MSLQEYTDEDLKKELECREREAKPTVIKNPDWADVIQMATDHIEEVNNGNARELDTNYMFEGVLEALYGPDIWDWYNPKI